MEQLNGLLVVNKPRGLSSAQCTNRLKRLGQRKIGHAGTLDPMARGVLLVLLGQATKLSGYLISGGMKTYKAVVEFGRSTDTWDDEGSVFSSLSEEEMRRLVLENIGFEAALRAGVAAWIGESKQAVPPYSAAKHEGRALYSLARAGQETPEKFKTVRISHAEVLWVDLPRAAFRVVCSSGTYIRSLAHSLGTRLSCGAVLTELIREYSHPFGLDSATALDDLLADPESLYEKLIPLTAALPEWPSLLVSAGDERTVKNGTPLAAERLGGQEDIWTPGGKAILLAANGAPLALAEAARNGNTRVWTVLRGLWA